MSGFGVFGWLDVEVRKLRQHFRGARCSVQGMMKASSFKDAVL